MKLGLNQLIVCVTALFLISCSMAMTQAEKTYRVCTKTPHAWPESIDVDPTGNIYFTDAAEGTLYRIKRNKDNSLAQREELLLKGFKRASGSSIDSVSKVLYMGVVLRWQGKKEYKILGIPLDIFNTCRDFPYSYSGLKECAEQNNNEIFEISIPKPPNGVIFNSKLQLAFYTYERLGLLAYFFKLKGHIGKTTVRTDSEVKIIQEMRSPNGIDLCQTVRGTVLVVAATLDNAVRLMRVSEDKAEQILTIPLGKSGDKFPGHLPDGLICLENGDILLAAFGSGQILYLAKDGNRYLGPYRLAEGLGHPTDLVLWSSSQNVTRSIFVTTKETWFISFKSTAKGKVVEIQDIDTLIEEKKARISKK
jgi:sugar lactone lactonase YvrE